MLSKQPIKRKPEKQSVRVGGSYHGDEVRIAQRNRTVCKKPAIIWLKQNIFRQFLAAHMEFYCLR